MKRIAWIVLLVLTTNVYAVYSHDQSTFGYVDLLYWQVRESGADNWGQLATKTGSHTQYTVLDAPFDWNTGIRLGIGHTFNQGHSDARFEYTHYQASATSQASGTVISAFDGNYFANNTNGAALDLPYSSANIRYQLFYDTIDLTLGQHYQVDTALSFHPYLGIKLATINQNIYSNWRDPIPATDFTTATENLKNNFSGVGPSVGVDSNWSLYKGAAYSLDLIGNLVTGLLYGHTTLSDIYANNKPVNIIVYNTSINGASPMIGGIMGLQWHSQLAKSDISLSVGYEAQIWFNQVQFYSLNMGKIIRPVTFQGGNLACQFNF